MRPTRELSLARSLLFGAGNLGAGAVYGFLNLAVGLYLERYPAVPAWAVGILSQERSFAGAFVQPIVGAMSDRTRTPIGRRKPFFIAGIALTAASLLYLAGFPPLAPMLVVLAVNAFFLNVAVDPYMALLADIVPVGQRGRIGAVLAIFGMVGQILATVAGLFLWDRSPELVFTLVTVVLVLSWIITTIGVQEPDAPPRPTGTVRIRPVAYVRSLLAERELVKYVLAASLFWLGTGGVLPYLTRFGVHVLGISEGQSFQLFLPALIGTIVAAAPAGYAADRLGKLPVLAGGVFAFSMIAFVASQVTTLEQALIAMAFVGLANGVWTSLAVPLLIDLTPPERAAEISGLGSGIWSLTQPVGALIAGILIESFGTYRVSFVGAASFVLLSFVLLLTVRPARAHHAVVAPA